MNKQHKKDGQAEPQGQAADDTPQTERQQAAQTAQPQPLQAGQSQTSSQPPQNVDAAELEQRVAELTEALLRERADATNVRRRADEQIAAVSSVVKAEVVRELLPVIDNFERALKVVPKDLTDNDFVKGVQGVVKQFEKSLADLGVMRIKTVGQPFDPHLHEAVSMDAGDGGQEIVSEELQAGYLLGNEVIRVAMVRVRG
jgi:molecular chaperone GrpE